MSSKNQSQDSVKLHANIAFKWSAYSELIAKLLSPITNMILARILAPEAFGVIAIVTMIISFFDMLTEAGFQRYLVFAQDIDEDELKNSCNVAFWINFSISIMIMLILMFFSNEIADSLSIVGYGSVVWFSALQLPITSFSSVQSAILGRDFNFKKLFYVRLMGILVPLFVTVPLAYVGFEHWALVIGTLLSKLITTIGMNRFSKWRPSLLFNISKLKNMFNYSGWVFIESIAIWLTIWADTFIISHFLSTYYLGLYRTSITMVNLLFSTITATITPVLFTALSKLKSNEFEFNLFFLTVQKNVAYIVLPIGVGVYIFRDLATNILFGSKWTEASELVGIWALITAIMIVYTNLNGEVFRAKGKSRTAFVFQIIHLFILIPVCIYAVKLEFNDFIIARSLIRLQALVTGLLFLQFATSLSIRRIIRNTMKPVLFTGMMSGCAVLGREISNSVLTDFVVIFISILIYIVLVRRFAYEDYRNAVKLVFNNRGE